MSSVFCVTQLEVTHSAIRSHLVVLPVNRSRTSEFTAADLPTWPYHRPDNAAGVPRCFQDFLSYCCRLITTAIQPQPADTQQEPPGNRHNGSFAPLPRSDAMIDVGQLAVEANRDPTGFH